MIVTIGFRVKSGQAIAVVLAGPAEEPNALDRQIVLLSDPDIAESRQPYHASMGKLETDETELRRRKSIVHKAAKRSVNDLIHDVRTSGHQILSAMLVVGSVTDPAKITNPHIRAHALEGRLFRTALEKALESCEVVSSVTTERDVYVKGVKALERSEKILKRQLAQMGKALDGPWRIDEKAAALAAWMALARVQPRI